MATVNLESITKSFGSVQVLHDISLAIQDKEFIVFVGPSGCGKSTLLRVIAGLEEATTGTIRIGGRDVSKAAPVDRGISMVFQSYALYPHLSVYENIAFPLRVQKLAAADLDARVKRAAEILQLTEKLPLKPGQLSGGQRQRVAIGRSIVREPEVFLFDEPLSNLDAALRGEMRVELSQLHSSLNATMIYVTHDQVEAMTMADRIVVLKDGYVEQFGTPMELYHHPENKFVASFIGQPNMNFLGGTVTGVDDGLLSVDLDGGDPMRLPVQTAGVRVGDKVDVGVRPEDLEIADRGIALDVDVVERLGGETVAYGHVGSDRRRFCATLEGFAPVGESQRIHLGIDPANAHVFDAAGRVLRRLKTPQIEELVLA